MRRAQNIQAATLALTLGFIGGVASDQIGQTVFAQEKPAYFETIDTRSIRLMIDGREYGLITASDSAGGVILLKDAKGKIVWTAPPMTQVHPLK